MRAVVLHGPNDLRVDEVPAPDLPPGGLLVRPGAIGICGSDVRTWRHGSSRLRGPQILGHEFAGTVTASAVASVPVGTRVAVCPGAPCLDCDACRAEKANLCPNRRVLGYDLPGGMAELVAIPDDWIRTGGVVVLGAAQPIERGALVEPLHTVVNGQDQVRIRSGERVLVLGLGPIGVLHVALARSGGASVIGVDPDGARVATAGSILPGAAVDTMDDGWAARMGLALGAPPDVVVVAVGAQQALASAVEQVAPGGRILAFAGLPPDDRVLDVDMNDLHYRQLTIAGAFGGTPATFRRAAAWLASNPLDVAAFAPERFGLSDALDAFATAASGRGLKTMLIADDRGSRISGTEADQDG